MNRRTLILGASALGVAAFAGGAFVLKQRRDAEAEAVAAATPTEDQALLVRDYSPSFGPADAPFTLVEFFDPSCEACRAYRGGPDFPDSLAALLRLILSLSRRQFDALVAAMGFEGCSAAQA